MSVWISCSNFAAKQARSPERLGSEPCKTYSGLGVYICAHLGVLQVYWPWPSPRAVAQDSGIREKGLEVPKARSGRPAGHHGPFPPPVTRLWAGGLASAFSESRSGTGAVVNALRTGLVGGTLP